MVSRQGHDSEESARKVDLAQFPDMLGVHAVICVSYPVDPGIEPTGPLYVARPPLTGSKSTPRPLAIDVTRRADLPRPPTLAEAQNGICFLCNQPMLPGDELGEPNLHHVIPASKGGKACRRTRR